MSTSQRVSRGVHRLAFFLCAVCAASQSFAAQITDTQTQFSMLCVAEKGTGFEWKNNDWVQAMYEPYAYILSKLDRDKDCSSVRSTERENFARPINPVSSWQGKSAGCYRLKEVGEKEGGIGYSCDESWKRRDEGYVLHYVKCDGGLNHYMAAVDGPFALTRTYSIFWDSEEGEEKKDSMVLQIGKCSLLTGTTNEK